MPKSDCGKADCTVSYGIDICFWRKWRQSRGQRNDHYADRRNGHRR